MSGRTAEAIARAFHDEYEAFAEAHGWETQESTRVAFDDLPAENRATMVSTVQALLDRKIISANFTQPVPGNSGGVEEGRWRIEDSGDWLSRYDALTRAEAMKHTAERLSEFFKAEGEPCTDEEAADEAVEIIDAATASPNTEQEQDGVCVTYLAASTQPPSPQAEVQDCEALEVATERAARFEKTLRVIAGEDGGTRGFVALRTLARQALDSVNDSSKEGGNRG